jgi:alanine racemase
VPTDQPAEAPAGQPAELLAGLPAGLPAAAIIDLGAIRHNVRVLCERAAPAAVMAVVKADAYGHGLVPCARAALEGGATWLGVAQLAEGLALRRAGITAPMLAWLTVPGDAYADAITQGIDLGVSSIQALEEIAAAARDLGDVARIQLKADTGLNRNGVAPADWADVVQSALKHQAEGSVQLAGAFSHYAWADAPDHPAVAQQTLALAQAVALAQQLGARFEVTHLANSAATVTNPGSHFDLVRPGLAIYGLSPVPHLATAATLGLRPAMTLLARVANVKAVPAGQGVSYGHAYVTPEATRLALLPVGYGDGIPRHASNLGPVALGGARHRVAGRVCMDQIVIDLGRDHAGEDFADVREGDVAVIFGPDDDETHVRPTAQDWADVSGTISYEIVTRLGARVPRIYVDPADG